MSEIVFRKEDARQVYPIGYARQTDDGFRLEIGEPFRPGLKQLGQFSHVIVFWWADQHDNLPDRRTLVAALPYAPGETAGVFACRSEYRPNPIAMTICPVFDVDEQNGVILVAWIDAFDGTPILDLKPYVPLSDRVRDVQVAKWFQGLPEWMEDAATFDFEAFFNPGGE
jgi:tRNA-Thr(GGU) m(6)t(6)A37 methyltransferase TsaA